MYKIIFFDLDGTIINSKVGIINSLNYMTNKMHWNEINSSDYLKFIGPPLSETISNYFHINNKNVIDNAISFFQDYYKNCGIFQCELYPDILYMLNLLYDNDKKLFITTSKPEIMAKKIVSFLNLNVYFTNIFGATLDESIRSKKVQIISYAISSLGLSNYLNNILMVGDRDVDILGAQKNKIKSISVSYGFGKKSEFCYKNNLSVLSSPLDVARWILNH